jgi:hypothetical protein
MDLVRLCHMNVYMSLELMTFGKGELKEQVR